MAWRSKRSQQNRERSSCCIERDLLALDAVVDQAQTEDRQQAMKLSEELGGLPLALDQAGAYIAKVQCTLESYQQLYQTHRRQLLQERRGKEHPRSGCHHLEAVVKRVER